MSTAESRVVARRSHPVAFIAGAGVGMLGGLIGLGGAEFRLPILISLFGFVALQAVILNKAMSLVVVAVALPARLLAVPASELLPYWPIVVNLVIGSVIGAWIGASWATKMRPMTLHRVLAVLLVLIAVALVGSHLGHLEPVQLSAVPRVVLGVLAGLVIGIVASLMGVAGGELLIPTIVLLYGIDVKVAGSLALAVSLPTMLVGFARYSRDQSFGVLRANSGFVVAMAAGSIVGVIAGGLLLGVVTSALLIPLLSLLLVASAIKVWRDG